MMSLYDIHSKQSVTPFSACFFRYMTYAPDQDALFVSDTMNSKVRGRVVAEIWILCKFCVRIFLKIHFDAHLLCAQIKKLDLTTNTVSVLAGR